MNALEATGTNPAVTGALRQASRLTGTDFQYLVATASVESGFNPRAAAPTTSARGLFQFIEQTWLATLKEHGPGLGYGKAADAIARTPSGQYAVSDPRLADRIMKLRFDPTANAVMAGAYTRANADALADRLGRKATEGELYLAHFLGSAGAGRLISLAESRPNARAGDVFPGQARSNPSIFYERGRARSVSEVYRMLVGRYAAARDQAAPARQAQQPAMAAAVTAPAAIPAPAPASTLTAFAPDAAELTQAYADAAKLSALPKVDAAPVFHGLFRTNPRREAVAPVVSALWNAPTPVKGNPAPVAGAADAAPDPQPGSSFNLFQDGAADARALFRGRV